MKRILFLQHEQRQMYWQEPGHMELYRPMIASNLLGEVRSYPYQRSVRYFRFLNSRMKENIKKTLDSGPYINEDIFIANDLENTCAEFKPDLVVYAITWPIECINPIILNDLKEKFNFKIFSIVSDHDDTDPTFVECDRQIIEISDITYIADSFYRAEKIRNKEGVFYNFKNTESVYFAPMAVDLNLFTPSFDKKNSLLVAGSSEGHRQNVYENLKKKYNVKRIGGLIEGDIYLSHEEYAKEISQSMIVINRYCYFNNSIKGTCKSMLCSRCIIFN